MRFRRRVAATLLRVAAFVVAQAVAWQQKVPSAPRSLEVHQYNATAYRVAWSPPEFPNGQLFGYYVYQDKLVNGAPIANGRRKAAVLLNKDANNTLITDFEHNTEYVIRVNAFNANGDGEYASSAHFITGKSPPRPPRPQSISLLDENPPLRARVEWLPAINPSDGSTAPIDGYIVMFRAVGESEWRSAEADADARGVLLESLRMGTEYELQIASFNADGRSENVTERLNTPIGRPSAVPLNVRYSVNGDKIAFQWDPPEVSRRNGQVIAYHAVLACSDNSPPKHQNVSRLWTTYSIDVRKSYGFRVAATTAKGDGPFSDQIQIRPADSALVGPPTNVSIQALTNDSVVVQWDFDEQLNGGLADGFVVKYIHEPGRDEHSVKNMDAWKPQSVMDPKARHLEIARLTAHKPYAFCVLAIKNSRLGPCSDPPTTIDRILPTRVVQNLHVQYKTSQSVALHWDFDSALDSSGNYGFFIKQSGTKTYRTQYLKEETLTAPGFERRIAFSERNFLWSSLRANMNYTFKVGVYSTDDGRVFWPREITVRTDSMGPPLVDTPEFVESKAAGSALLKLNCATEEQGPISHYWIVVVPGNYSKEDVMNVDSQQLIQSTYRLRQKAGNGAPRLSAGTAGGGAQRRRALDESEDEADDTEEQPITGIGSRKRRSPFEPLDDLREVPWKRQRRAKSRHRRHGERRTREPAPPIIHRSLDGVYISAQLSHQQVERLQRNDELFALGDGREYAGFWNMPLEPNAKYRVMSRAFAADEQRASRFDRPFEYRAPMQEPASKLFTDSLISDPFAPRPVLMSRVAARGSSFWIIGPLGALAVMVVIVGMLVVWWLKCSRKGSSTGAFGMTVGNGTLSRRHGSITKIALGTDFGQLNGNGNGIYGPAAMSQRGPETDKLLNGNGVLSNGTLSRTDGMNGTFGRSAAVAPQPEPALYDLYAPNNGGLSVSQNSLQPISIYGTASRAPPNLSLNGVHSASQMTPLMHSTTIPLSEFQTRVERLKMNGNEMFIKEFESIETDQHFTWEHSNLEVNKAKNRYANVVAYDHSRVVLSPATRSATGGPTNGILSRDDDEEEPGSDYINANYIDGYSRPRAYIATQGPLPETFADFWRMVWEERSAVVVMLTRLEERSRVKCSQYWPSRGSTTYGHIVVSVLNTVELAHYTIRTMRLEHLMEGEVREIKHAQYTSWPDHGVPDHPTPFLMFLKKVKALNPPGAGALITHCSAGVGRTGAFIVVDCMVERIYMENSVDIYGCVKSLRTQRMYMVQTEEQYIFIHEAVLDAAQSGSTEVPAKDLKPHIEKNIRAGIQGKVTGLDLEFQSLLSLHPPNASCLAAQLPTNVGKNRHPEQLPFDANRVLLQRPTKDGSDYINASWIDSYQQRRAYIATQAPMPETVPDFWQMIWESDACVIVMLTGRPSAPRVGFDGTPPQLERYAEYWPLDKPLRYGDLMVDTSTEYQLDSCVLHEFHVTHLTTKESRTVRHFQYLNWNDRDVDNLIKFIQEVHTAKQKFGLDGPMCVHCATGAGRTGVFIAIATIIERINLEQMVDVFTTVKLLRAQRLCSVETKAELELVYDAALSYWMQFGPQPVIHNGGPMNGYLR